MPTKSLAELLEYIENRIDIDHEREKIEKHKKAMRFEEVDSLPVYAMLPPDLEWGQFPIKESFYDPEKMLYNELVKSKANVVNSFELNDDQPLHVRANFGIGSVASMFGIEVKIVDDNPPWVTHLDSIDEIRKIVDRGVPDLESGLAPRFREFHQFYTEKLADWPKCSKTIFITQPDLQGPFDIAALIWGSSIFVDLFEQRRLLHDFLSLITETYIEVCRDIKTQINEDAGDGFIVLHGAVIPAACLIKCDSLVSLSPQMCREFITSYCEKIFTAFPQGGGIHSCGNFQHSLDVILKTKGFKVIDIGQAHLMEMNSFIRKTSHARIPITQLDPEIFSNMSEIPKTGMMIRAISETKEQAKRTIAAFKAQN